MEYWDIYDKNKQLTGRKMKRNDWCLKEDEYHLTVLGVIRRPDGKYLITRRVLTKAWAPGWWEVSGGAAQAGESSEEAVRREVLEETGLHIKNLKYFMIFQSRIYFNHNSVQLEPIFFRGRYIFNGNILFSIDFMVHYVFRRSILVIYLFEFGRRYIHT